MPMNLGANPTPLDDTTLVVFKGSRKPVAPDRKRDLARRCSVTFIRLRWKESLNTTVGVCGFQHVKLRVVPQKGGRREPSAQWDQNEYTMMPKAEGAMDFVPDEMGTGYAYLPDSPFNRVTLAKAEIGKNALWEFDDDAVHEEIKQLADEIRKSTEHLLEVEDLERKQTEVKIRVHEQNVKSGVKVKTRIDVENEVLESKIQQEEAKAKRAELRKRLADLQAQRGEPVRERTNKVPPPETVEDVVDDASSEAGPPKQDDTPKKGKPRMSPEKVKELRAKARAQVYEEKRELIAEVKQIHAMQSGKEAGWGFSVEYRNRIQPLINDRLEELINEYTAVSNAD